MEIAHIALSVLKYIFVVGVGVEIVLILAALVRLAHEKARPAPLAPAAEE